MSVYKKLLEARKIIRENGISKDGENKYSNYEYFTPDGVKAATGGACQEVGLLPVFSLVKDEIGLHGRLRIIDVDDPESEVTFHVSTAIPEITATNVTQQVGGCITYTERYALMVAFEIADNKDDFDAQDNRKQKKWDDSQPQQTRSFLKKKSHISEETKKEFVKKEEAPVEELEGGELEEPTELDLLRAKCDELGITYTGRHKEAGLKKLIKEYEEAEATMDEPDEAEEPVRSFSADEEMQEEMSDKAIDMAISQYQELIEGYEDPNKLKADALSIIQKAQESGIPDEDVAVIKAMVNDKYISLT